MPIESDILFIGLTTEYCVGNGEGQIYLIHSRTPIIFVNP